MSFSPLDKGEVSVRTEGVFPIELDGDQVKNLKFIDMCTGPHVSNTKELDPNSFKLARVAGAYWLGNSDNKQLTRIYAYAFDNLLHCQCSFLERCLASFSNILAFSPFLVS